MINHCTYKGVQCEICQLIFFSKSKFLVFVRTGSFWNVVRNSFYSTSYLQFINCHFEPSWLQIAAAFSKYDLSQTSFPSFPFNFYFVTFSSDSLVGLGFDSHDNAPGFNDVF